MLTYSISSIMQCCDQLCGDILLSNNKTPEAAAAVTRLRNLKGRLCDPTLSDTDILTWAPSMIKRLSDVDPTTNAGIQTILAAVPINPPGLCSTFQAQATGDLTFP